MNRVGNPRQAAATLIGLCRSGHEEGVVRTLIGALHQRPRVVQTVMQIDNVLKILDPAEEQRVQAILKPNSYPR